MACKLTVKRGHNIWLLARTNRDAPSPSEVIETTAAFLIKVLGAASPVADRGAFETVQSPAGNRRYYIGAARPVEIEASEEPPDQALPGEVLARREDCPEPYMATVEGSHVWHVWVEFDWRGNDVQIDWPRRRVNWFGIPSDDEPDRPFDWLLLQANFVPEAATEDSSLLHDVIAVASERFDEEADSLIESIKKGIDNTARVLMWIAAGAFAVALVYAYRKGGK